ncbi:MAG: radical SAM protein [Candidatus Tectomicrobia bacterium]|nr:radical SAM protein [Candidatus Tectomicrobia bacterium]
MQWREAARVAARLVAAKVTGASVPLHVTLYVTTHCNLRCVYCSYPSRNEAELSAAEWRAVLDELRALGARRVLFFGGEPLLRRDLGEIVAHARELGLRCAMVSNGTLVPNRPEVVKRLHTLTLSLDGDAAAHDRNRGEGSHREVLRAIEAARSWQVPVKINAVLNANNAHLLGWLLEFSRREGLPLSLNLMRSEENGLYQDAAQHRLQDARMRQVVAAIREAKKSNPQILFSSSSYEVLRQWPNFSVDRLRDVEALRGFPGPPCSAGRFHCVIYANGDLYPCAMTVRQMPALNVKTAGVAAAQARTRHHGCATCSSACMLETNAMFALQPRVLASLATRYLRSRYT